MTAGCVCPPTCELTCKAEACPRKPISNADYWAFQEAQTKWAARSRDVPVLTWEEDRIRRNVTI